MRNCAISRPYQANRFSFMNYRLGMSMLITLFVCAAAFTGNIGLGFVSLGLSIYGLFNPLALLPTAFVVALSSDYYTLGGGVGLNRVIFLFVIGGLLIRCVRDKGIVPRFNFAASIVLLALVYSFSYLQAISRTSEMAINIATMIAMLLLASGVTLSNEESIQLISDFRQSAVIALIFVLLTMLVNPTYIGGRTTIGTLSPNRFSVIVVQLFAILVATCSSSRKRRLTYLVALPACAYMVLLSGSRTGLICIVGVVLIAGILSNVGNNSSIIKWVATAFILAIAAILLHQYIQSVPELAARFDFSEVAEDGGTGRMDRIQVAFNYIIPNHLLLGVGPFENEQLALFPFFPVAGAASAHNIFVSMLINLGLLGVVAYALVYGRLFVLSYKEFKHKRLLLLPLLLLLVTVCNGIGEVVYYEKYFWVSTAVAFVLLNSNGEFGVYQGVEFDGE